MGSATVENVPEACHNRCMIIKTKDPKPAANKFEQAGDAAEEQMAFYLRRAFGDAADIYVFNDLRLIEGEEVAQIDHLVLHKYGFFIVESKSVSGEVTVNQHGEWVRQWGGQRVGMKSPIQQARLQGELLRKLLNDNCEQLRDKYIFGLMQGGFKHCPIDVCVAISDKGIINRRGIDPPELCKADMVCDRIKAEIERHRHGQKLLGKSDGDYGLYTIKPQESERIRAFLLARHSPLSAQAGSSVPPPIPAAPRTATPAPQTEPKSGEAQPEGASCKHCGSNELQATYGQYGYYFKCSPCGKNTPMDFKCGSCGAKARIRKQGPRFDRVCGCGVERLVWINTRG